MVYASKLRKLWRQASVMLSVYYANMLEYRAEIVLWTLASCLPIILMGVWIQAAQSSDFGLSSTQFAQYFFSVFIIRQLTMVWVIWEFEKQVLEGSLSFRLLQPMDPIWHHISEHIAEKVSRLPLILGLIALFLTLYPQAIWIPSGSQILLCLGAIALGLVLRFLIQYTFAMLAFWTERATAIEQFWFLFYTFLSGVVAPLEVFPPLIKEIVLWTPFPYLIYFPVAILIGLPVNYLRSVAITLGWTCIFFLLNRWLWRKGLRQYSGMGS